MISRRLATLQELDTIYGGRDLYLLREIGMVDAHNANVAAQPRQR